MLLSRTYLIKKYRQVIYVYWLFLLEWLQDGFQIYILNYKSFVSRLTLLLKPFWIFRWICFYLTFLLGRNFHTQRGNCSNLKRKIRCHILGEKTIIKRFELSENKKKIKQKGKRSKVTHPTNFWRTGHWKTSYNSFSDIFIRWMRTHHKHAREYAITFSARKQFFHNFCTH